MHVSKRSEGNYGIVVNLIAATCARLECEMMTRLQIMPYKRLTTLWISRVTALVARISLVADRGKNKGYRYGHYCKHFINDFAHAK
nr:unnamed protein product [Haemonchus contortus]